jgi:hypothetical protein
VLAIRHPPCWTVLGKAQVPLGSIVHWEEHHAQLTWCRRLRRLRSRSWREARPAVAAKRLGNMARRQCGGVLFRVAENSDLPRLSGNQPKGASGFRLIVATAFC